tara:strand:- start:42 stop:1604 length:1563 start_codon:yes stop_codon:yes gene_type:complete
MKDNIDFIVIGSGASGAAFSWKMSMAGAKVVCIEQGDYVKTNSYPKKKKDIEIASLKEWNWNPNVRKNKFDYPINNSNSPIHPLMYNSVGGSTLHYTAHTPRFHPSDFKVKTLDSISHDWPISYFDLEKFYDENDEMMGCSGISGDPANPPRSERSFKPVPLGEDGEIIAKAFDRLGWHWWPSDSYVNSDHFKDNWKFYGSHALMDRKSISSTDKNYLPEAINNGAKLLTKCRVNKIILDNKNKAKGVTYIKDGKEFELKGDNVVLASNAIGTPRILLMSSTVNHENGLGNSSGLLGKNLMFHPYAFIRGQFEGDNKFFNGPNANILMSQQFYETDTRRDFYRGFTLQMVRNNGPVFSSIELDWGENHHNEFKDFFGNSIGFSIIAEDLPETTNFVSLDKKNKDSDGLPGISVNYKVSQNSRKILDFALRKSKEVLIEAGSKKIFENPLMRYAGWHLMGTAKMGDNPENSVTNKYGRLHDIENIYVVDGSLFVTSGSVNPTPTIQALSLYIAESIIKGEN